MIVVVALLGAFSWTFLEYVLHRWLGHDARYRRNPFGVEHVRHHVEGDYFAPSYKKLIIAAITSVVLCVPAILLAGRTLGIAYVLGLMGFYGAYEVLHRLEHTHPGIGPYGRWARRHHLYHHFVDGRANHGVTSPLWDFVFGTYRKPGVITVPRKLCVSWLKDPVTGDVRAAFADTYALKG